MAVTYQASGALTGAINTATVTPPVPVHAVGDILICITSNRVTTNTCPTPAGWSLLFGPVDTGSWRSYVFWIRTTTTNTTAPLCAWTTTSADKYAQVHSLRGAIASGSPFAVSAWTAGTANPAVATGVTTLTANQYVCLLGLQADNLAAVSTYTPTNPASLTERHDSTTTTGADAGGFFADGVRATAGATGNVSVAFSAAPLQWGILVAAIADATTVVSKTQATTWAVKGTISKTVAESWAVTTSVAPKTVAETWAVRQQVTAGGYPDDYSDTFIDFSQTWNVTGRIVQTTAQTWAVKTTVSPQTSAQTWAVRARANQNTVQNWSVRAAVAKSSVQSWGVRASAAQSVAEAWAVRATVAKAVAETWNVRSIVSASSAQLWNVFATGQVSQALIQTWNVRALATKSLAEAWNVQTPVASSSVQSWGVKITAGPKIVAQSWAVGRRITATYLTQWNVLIQGGGTGGNTWIGATTGGGSRWGTVEADLRWQSTSGAVRWSVGG